MNFRATPPISNGKITQCRAARQARGAGSSLARPRAVAAFAAFVLVLTSTASPHVCAADPVAFTSQLLAPNPEWQAMRGSRAATAPGIAAVLGNPAAIAGSDGISVECSHLEWAGGLSREWAAAGWSLAHGISLAADAAAMHGPDLAGYDVNGTATAPFHPTEWSAGLHAAMPIRGGLSIGLGARLFRLGDPTEPLTGEGLSIGLQARGYDRTVGIALTDAGASLHGSQGTYALPTRWRAGFEQEVSDRRVLVAASLQGETAGSTRGGLGVIVRPLASMDLMGGLLTGSSARGESPVGWSAGATMVTRSIAVAYAYLQDQALGSTHQVGIRFERRNDRREHAGSGALPRTESTDRIRSSGDPAPRPAVVPPPTTPPTTSAAEVVQPAPEVVPPAAEPLPTATPAVPPSPATVVLGYAVFGGRYHASADAQAELTVFHREGFDRARVFREGEGRWRVLVLECGSSLAADEAVSRLRDRSIAVNAEPITAPLPATESADSR